MNGEQFFCCLRGWLETGNDMTEQMLLLTVQDQEAFSVLS